jgi:hypothetical protein
LALADAFVSAHPSTSVGLIPCARGATKIGEWLKTKTDDQRSTLYGSCMNRMKTVSPANGTIRAVIFWQGGSDAKNQEDALSWKDRFTAFVAELRSTGPDGLGFMLTLPARRERLVFGPRLRLPD